ADLGKSAGKLLLLTSVLAYGFTILTGFFTYITCTVFYPTLLGDNGGVPEVDNAVKTLEPYFTLNMPPLLDVMSALIFAFVMGLGMAFVQGNVLKRSFDEFKNIIMRVINHAIIPILHNYTFSIFLNITYSVHIESILSSFVKILVLIFILTVILLLIQFAIAGAAAKEI